MLLGSVGAALANAGLVLADGPLLATPLRFATGAFLAAVYPPALKEMATWFRRGRGTALGVLVGALTVGSAAPHLVNALGGASWRLVVVVTSVLTVAGGLVAELAGRDGPFPFPRTSFDARQARQAFGNRGVRLATLGYFGHMWELYAMWAWILVFLTDAFADAGRPGRAGPAFAAFAVIGIGGLGCWVGGILGDRWGRCRLTALAMLLSGSCALVIGLLRDAPLPVLLGVALVWGFWVVADSAQFSTVVTEVADQRYVGTALTLQLAVGFTLTVVTIYLVPVLRDGSAGSGPSPSSRPARSSGRSPCCGCSAPRTPRRSPAGEADVRRSSPAEPIGPDPLGDGTRVAVDAVDDRAVQPGLPREPHPVQARYG